MDGFDDCDMGYTPAHGVNRSVSELFHRPWDRGQNGGRVAAVRTKPRIQDPLFQKLSGLMDECADTQPGGCAACPRQRGCSRWWGGIADEANHGRRTMTPEMFKRCRKEFETRIKPR
jgi:hypothetical protein